LGTIRERYITKLLGIEKNQETLKKAKDKEPFFDSFTEALLRNLEKEFKKSIPRHNC